MWIRYKDNGYGCSGMIRVAELYITKEINSTIYIMANENTPVCRVQSKEIGDKILDHIIKSIKLGILSVNINDTCKSFENE